MNIFPSVDFVVIFALDIILGTIDTLLILRLYYRIYGPPSISRGRLTLYGILLFLISAIGWRFYTAYYHPTALPPVTVLFTAALLPYFKPCRVGKKILFLILLIAISGLLTIVTDLIVTPMDLDFYLVAYFIPHASLWLLLEIIGYINRKKRQSIPMFMSVVLGVISVTSLAVFFYMLADVAITENPYGSPFFLVTASALLIINFALFFLYDRIAIFTESETEKALLAEQLRLQEQHYREIEGLQNQIRVLHHDMKNNLAAATALSEKDGYHSLKEYLKGASQKMQSYEQTIFTQNEALDTILNLKIQELRDHDIKITTNIILPPNLNISFHQAVTIWGNLLDNAKEACVSPSQEKRWVHISLSFINYVLVSTIKNPLQHPIEKWEYGLPLSTKKDPLSHSIGLQNVEQTVNANGTLSINATDELFEVTIVLYDL